MAPAGARVRYLAAAGSTVIAGLLTYVFLGAASRSLDDAAFDLFSVFWSASLVIGFGLFLPVEQELARRGRLLAVRRAALVGWVLAAVGGVALVVAAPWIVGGGVLDTPLVVLAVLLAVVSPLQYAARGAMLGRDLVATYGLVLTVDAVARACGATLVALLDAAGVLTARPWHFAAVLVASIAVVHGAALVHVRRREAPDAPVATDPVPWRPVLTLVPQGLAAQLLLNGGPVLVQAVGGAVGASGAFQASFNVARVPLFMLVPLQALLVAPIVRLREQDREGALVARLLAVAGAIAVVGVVAGVVAWLVGPWVVELVFGAGRSIPGPLLGLLVGAVFAHVGLVVATQALVALARHAGAAVVTVVGFVAAIVVFAALVADPVAAAVVAFGVGSLVGWVGALLLLLVPDRRAAREVAP